MRGIVLLGPWLWRGTMSGSSEKKVAASIVKYSAGGQVPLGALRRGDADAWRVVFEEHRDDLNRAAWGILRDEEAALEVVQEAFVGAIQGVAGFRERCHIKTWLTSIVIHKAIDARRKRNLAPTHTSLDAFLANVIAAPGREAPDMDAIRSELRERAFDYLEQLPSYQRQAFILRNINGMKLADIGVLFDRSPSTIHRWVEDARTWLVQRMDFGT